MKCLIAVLALMIFQGQSSRAEELAEDGMAITKFEQKQAAESEEDGMAITKNEIKKCRISLIENGTKAIFFLRVGAKSVTPSENSPTLLDFDATTITSIVRGTMSRKTYIAIVKVDKSTCEEISSSAFAVSDL
jgi:hypothetical protein